MRDLVRSSVRTADPTDGPSVRANPVGSATRTTRNAKTRTLRLTAGVFGPHSGPYAARRAHWESAWQSGQISAPGLQRGYDAVRAIVGHAHSRGWRSFDLARHPAPEV